MSWDDLNGLSPQVYNNQFLQKLAEEPGTVQQVGDNFVKDRLREGMVFNKIIPQKPVSVDKLQVSLTEDTHYEVIHLEPNAAASIADFRGMGRSQVVRGKRIPLTFHRLQSDIFEIVEEELLAYPYPIVRLIHEFSINAIGDVHDLYMLQNAQRAADFVDNDAAYKALWGGGSVQGVQPDGTAYPNSTAEKFPLNTASFSKGKKAMSNRISPKSVIITKYDHDDLEVLDSLEIGFNMKDEIAVNGYRKPKFVNVDLVVTTKQDVFRPGNLWFFADEKMLGKNRVLDMGGNPYKLFIDRRGPVISWHVWANFGAVIANVGSVVKLKLYNTLYENDTNNVKAVDPTNITEDDLFEKRNLADAGGTFPTIRQF